MTSIFYEIGPLKVELQGYGLIYNAVLCELAPMISAIRRADIIFNFSTIERNTENSIISDSITINQEGFYGKHSGLSYKFERLFGRDGPYVITVNPKEVGTNRKSLTQYLRGENRLRILDWNYLNQAEIIAKNFIYDLFDYSTQIALLNVNATYIHASAVEKNGQAVLLAGRGSVGKSTFMLKTILEDGWCYLSDDLAIIDIDAVVWRTPKKMQIYGYNTVGEPIIRKRLFRSRSLIDLGAWYARMILKGIKRVRRRVAADDFFGASHVAKCAPLGKAIFLERHCSFNVDVNEISPDEFSYRCATVLLGELAPYSEIAISEHSANANPILPSITELHDRTYKTLKKALQKSRPLLVRIPEHMTPIELTECLKTILEKPVE